MLRGLYDFPSSMTVRALLLPVTSARHLKSLGSEVGRNRLHVPLIVNMKYSVTHFLLCRRLSFSSGDMKSVVIEGFTV